jgi:flagellin-like hook-associated protein FlgL
MRITLQSIHRNILGNLNKITTDMNRINKQISSGRQISTISEDPVNLVTALGLRTNLSSIAKYRDNLSFANSMIVAAESALTQMKDLALRAKTLAIQQANAPVNQANRANAAEEVRHLWEQAIFLGNSQVMGKYVFAGYRTAGYTAMEPAPFIAGLAEGYRASGNTVPAVNSTLTGTIDNTPPPDLAPGDLLINATDIGAVDLDSGLDFGLNMSGAFNLRDAINAAPMDPPVIAALTTLHGGGPATAEGGNGGETLQQSINGVAFEVVIPDGATAGEVSALTVEAINAVAAQTGVSARVGDGSNGGAVDAVVLYNTQPGDESDIEVGPLTGVNADTGLAAGTYSVGAANNTGQVSLSATESFTITTSSNDDTILARIGLAGSGIGFANTAGDGILRYGPSLEEGDLRINGIAVPASVADGLSSLYADASAASKAAAINSLNETTGVRAEITPASFGGGSAVAAGSLGPGDLRINGVDIFSDPTAISLRDEDNVLVNAINAQSADTGVIATRDSNGVLRLSAVDGRNVQIRTSLNGAGISRLNQPPYDTPADKVYFGTIQLVSDNQFFLESPTGTGLLAIGLDGGDDNMLQVVSIQRQDGNVRYAGDRNNDIAVKVSSYNALEITKNGQAAVMDTGIFTIFKNFENALRGENLTFVTGVHEATNFNALLNSGETGLEQEFKEVRDGRITITVTDHSFYPPRPMVMEITVDVANDTPADIAARLNGIPGLNAAFDPGPNEAVANHGRLNMESSDPGRYSFTFDDTSGFLELAGVTHEQMQLQAIDKAIADLDLLMDSLTARISDFGARANRIMVQDQIYINIQLAVSENLSEKQDTDLTQALMEMKAKDVAYQAALSAAAKTMQLSLVDFLR